MNSRVGRLGGHSHDSRNLTFLFRSREATTHRVYLNEVHTPLVRFWALPWEPRLLKAGTPVELVATGGLPGQLNFYRLDVGKVCCDFGP